LRYLIRRLALSAPTLLLASFVVFITVRVAPGDPALAMAGQNAPQEVVEQIRRDLGLDRPLLEQYGRFLWGLANLDLGRSIFSRLPVTVEIGARLPSSLILALGATLLAAVVGAAVGVIAATRQRTLFDYALMTSVVALLAIPSYVLGLLLILVFAVQLRFLPASGSATPQHYVLPILTLAAPAATVIARQTRAAVLEVLRQDYMRTARAKGLVERLVILRHALPNAMVPVVTIVGIQFGAFLSGLVIVETVFGVPGIGGLIVERILARDYPVVQGAVLMLAACMIAVNLVIDLLYAALDPRIRLT
jgi:ABC-type dipeptide/oligopeptide/nickel transport system permease component